MSYPNQRRIIIERQSDKATKDFLKVSNRNLEIAMYNLNNNAFKLWIYLVDNKNGYTMDLYAVDFCRITNTSESTYRRAFDTLVKYEYLIQSTKESNLYLFREVSNSDLIQMPDVINSIDKENIESIKQEYFQQK